MKLSIFALVNATLASSMTLKPKVGQGLAPVSITDKGEIKLREDGRIEHAHWQSSINTKNKIRCLQVMGGTLASKKINAAFIEKIEQAEQTGQLQPKTYQSITIINMKKCLPGTAFVVENQLNHYKTLYPHAALVSAYP